MWILGLGTLRGVRVGLWIDRFFNWMLYFESVS